MNVNALRDRWHQTIRGTGVTTVPATFDSSFFQLLSRYAARGRYYHAVSHLEHCFDVLDRFMTPEQAAVEFALWFHDAVHEPFLNKNEEQSAAVAEDFIVRELGLPEYVHPVKSLILLTKHTEAPKTREGCVVCDVDMSILGSSPSKYARYASGVRAEYASVPNDIYVRERNKVLRGFLDRPTIYYDQNMRFEFEDQARQNIQTEITENERVR